MADSSKMENKSVRFVLNFFQYIYSFPFIIDWEDSGKIIYTRSKRRLVCWRLTTISLFTYVFYNVFTLCKYVPIYLEARSYEKLIIHLFWWSAGILCWSYQLTVILKHKEMARLLNHTILLQRTLEERNGPDLFKEEKKTQEIIYRTYGMQCFGSTVSSMLAAAILHQEPWYVFNLIPPDIIWKYEDQIWPIVLTSIFQGLFEFQQWGAFAGISYVKLQYFQTVTKAMDKLRDLTTVSESVQNLQKLLNLYSEIRLLSKTFDNCFRYTFYPIFKTVCLLSSVSCLYLLCKSSKIGSVTITGMCFFLGSGCICTLIALAKYTAKINTTSKQLKQSLENMSLTSLEHDPYRNLNRKRHAILLKSYYVNAIRVGSYYQMERTTPLTLLKILLDSTMTMLLSFDF